jgi:hypothetical protein
MEAMSMLQCTIPLGGSLGDLRPDIEQYAAE